MNLSVLLLLFFSLEFRDASVSDVIIAISEVFDLNIIVDEISDKKISLSLKDVTYEEALSSVAYISGMKVVNFGKTFILLQKEKYLEISKFISDEQIEKSTIKKSVLRPKFVKPEEIQKILRHFLTKKGGVEIIAGGVVVKDIDENVEEIEKLFGLIDRKPKQILIKAKISEVSTSYLRDFGTGLKGKSKLGDAELTLKSPLSTEDNFSVSVAVSDELEAKISALEKEGKAKILSSPSISTVEGKEAVISQGFSVPYETISQYGTQTNFQDAFMTLSVIPSVTDEKMVSLDIKLTKNSPTSTITSFRGVPSILKNEAKTTVIVENGKTISIGGIYITEDIEDIQQVPFLSKIPVVGFLFKRKVVKKDEKELLLFITPHIL